MDYKTCLEIARQVMFEAGYDGTRSTIGVEPYSGMKARTEVGNTAVGGAWGGGGGSNSNTGSNNNARKKDRDQRNSGQPRKEFKQYSAMTLKEKSDTCCRGFNTAAGCSKLQCSFKHRCSHADAATNMVCWKFDHGLTSHK
jgi:hypothetical protein